jgi:uncharacterized protein YjbJ (UPF0337 family)
MQLGHVDINRIRGIADKIIGLSEETIGVVVGIDHWQGEGEARQERASQELKALRKAAKAEAKEANARLIGNQQERRSGSGAVAETKGKVKQAAGDVTGDKDLRRRGVADEERGRAERQATQARSEAKVHDLEARAAEGEVRRAHP